ncbi:unnamed protein product [Nesidiocoris tenuis]|uniref:Uncharacterized protein n=1 Tax=Nesidiocoris tenuis TaxID=355587 RepID=A0A6H5GPH9_9HEMI|nr:unnamed protein product [Nesidiocoris tenuis]
MKRRRMMRVKRRSKRSRSGRGRMRTKRRKRITRWRQRQRTRRRRRSRRSGGEGGGEEEIGEILEKLKNVSLKLQQNLNVEPEIERICCDRVCVVSYIASL